MQRNVRGRQRSSNQGYQNQSDGHYRHSGGDNQYQSQPRSYDSKDEQQKLMQMYQQQQQQLHQQQQKELQQQQQQQEVQQQKELQQQQQQQQHQKKEIQEDIQQNTNIANQQISASVNSDFSDDVMPTKNKWIRPKGKKVPSRVRRSRQNKRLRKLLTPKNALMSLNELSGIIVSDYTILPDDNGFVADVLVNNIRYEGRGTSKTAAKNNASEKALRDQIIQKMLTAPKITKANKPDVTDANNIVDDDAEMKSDEDEEKEIPMVHLASYALFKLFNEWEQEGFEIPDLKNHNGTTEKQTDPPKRPMRTELPANHETIHPTMLLTLMRPNTQYTSLGSTGTSPNMLHKIGITVDDQSFTGVSRNKKTARKNAAIEACNKLFGTKFEIEQIPTVPQLTQIKVEIK